jgi:hypothetical protein
VGPVSLRALAFIAALVLGGCGLAGGGARPTTNEAALDPDSVFVGYTLMYEFVSTQKASDKLLLIKRESDEVEAMINEISAVARDIEAQLKRIADAEPRIRLEAPVLPLMERKQRESARAERLKDFLGKSGKEFERLLLLTQAGSLTAERHIARAMREAETDPERKAFWEQTARRFDELYAKLVRLLEERYYS